MLLLTVRPLLFLIVLQLSLMTALEAAAIIRITTSEQYQKLLNNQKTGLLVVKFGATWCQACENIKHEYETIAEDPKYQHIIFADISLDQDATIGGPDGVRSIPTVLYFVDGKKVTETLGSENFRNKLEKNLALLKTKNGPLEEDKQTKKKVADITVMNVKEEAPKELSNVSPELYNDERKQQQEQPTIYEQILDYGKSAYQKVYDFFMK